MVAATAGQDVGRCRQRIANVRSFSFDDLDLLLLLLLSSFRLLFPVCCVVAVVVAVGRCSSIV